MNVKPHSTNMAHDMETEQRGRTWRLQWKLRFKRDDPSDLSVYFGTLTTITVITIVTFAVMGLVTTLTVIENISMSTCRVTSSTTISP